MSLFSPRSYVPVERGSGRRRPVVYRLALVLVLLTVVPACSQAEVQHEALPSAPLTARLPTLHPTTPSPVPVSSPSPSAPTPTSTSTYLPTATPLAQLTATPLPDEQDIVAAVLGVGSTDHWVAFPLSGSFTMPGAEEIVALVGNIGSADEMRWVVVRKTAEGGQLVGVSEWLGAGFASPPPFYLPPELLDFDGDGLYELLSHYHGIQRGRETAADELYRWNGRELARIWSAETLLDNTSADRQEVPIPYLMRYQAEWEWSDLDRDTRKDEILLQGHVVYYRMTTQELWGEESWKRAFCWDGEAFRPCQPGEPDATFAYTALGALWVWKDHMAQPVGPQHVRGFQWSPDGMQLMWWSQPPQENITFGVCDIISGSCKQFSLDTVEDLSTLEWTPEGSLLYELAGYPPMLLDVASGIRKPLSAPASGEWSPDSTLLAYEREGDLYVYDPARGEERLLIDGGNEAGIPMPWVAGKPSWSPRGEWIACTLTDGSLTRVGLVAPHLKEPAGSVVVFEAGKRGAENLTNLRFAWSSDGHYLALMPLPAPNTALTETTTLTRTVLYIAETPSAEGQTVGQPVWEPVLQLDNTGPVLGPAWSPRGRRLALAVGNELWEVTVGETAVLRRSFSVPEPTWTVLEWAPDGSGFIAGLEWGYDEHLYWFPARGGEPVLLVAGSLGVAQWSPWIRHNPGMVLVEYGDSVPRLHFVRADGSEIVVTAKGAEPHTQFHIGGPRVYYNKFYADTEGATSLFASGQLAGCRSPLPSQDGSKLAWLCDSGAPDWSEIISGTAQVHFRLLITDEDGHSPREVWQYTEKGPDYRDFELLGWRADGEVVYLSRPKYGTAWAYFDYNPGILALDVTTGQTTQLGDLENIHDGKVSADGTWLVQSQVAEWPREGVTLLLRSLVDGTERTITCAEGALVAGDFSFSPANTWLAWRELVKAPGGTMVLVRFVRLPDGEPLTVYGDAETSAPLIGGWLGEDELVLVYPRLSDGSGGHSAVVRLPATGAGEVFSPYTFVGLWNEEP
ncbi:MAG: hypothetical protein N2508_07330 [Anaerolineae bacterium]|nr:hypothetical protein [Anaerolineae bacterium]